MLEPALALASVHALACADGHTPLSPSPAFAFVAPTSTTGAQNQLKYRERDDISNCLRTWSRKVPFDMALAREHRQRKFFAERYDARHDVADWDYNMRLREVAPIIRYQHFRRWRMGGVAYELRDARYEQPNRTLASMAAGRAVEQYDRTTGQPKGRSILKRGFWGDIITGPYATFGVEADDERLYETSNKVRTRVWCGVGGCARWREATRVRSRGRSCASPRTY